VQKEPSSGSTANPCLFIYLYLVAETVHTFKHLLRVNLNYLSTCVCSYDYVDIYVGRRLVRRLSGGDDDDDDDDDDKDHYDDDDECDDDDDVHDSLDDLDDIDEEEDGRPKVVIIRGTGEMITIVFRSDYSVTKRGFFARYNVAALPPPGEYTKSFTK